ncbi:hypothetical protein D3C87_1429500 [compost metagenome]
MTSTFDQGMQANAQGFPASLNEPADDHQRGDHRKDHADTQLEKTDTEDTQRDPERTPQRETGHPKNDCRTENNDGCQRQTHHSGE